MILYLLVFLIISWYFQFDLSCYWTHIKFACTLDSIWLVKFLSFLVMYDKVCAKMLISCTKATPQAKIKKQNYTKSSNWSGGPVSAKVKKQSSPVGLTHQSSQYKLLFSLVYFCPKGLLSDSHPHTNQIATRVYQKTDLIIEKIINLWEFLSTREQIITTK